MLKPELQGYWQFFGRIDVGEGFFFHAPVPAETTRRQLRLPGPAAGGGRLRVRGEFDHVGFWDLRIMVASATARAASFIAGDAAHQHPPYGGFGLNTGLEDAANLGWKLRRSSRAGAATRCCDSYDEERRPIFEQTGEAMIAGGIEPRPRVARPLQPERDKAEFEAPGTSFEAAANTRQDLRAALRRLAVVLGGPGDAPQHPRRAIVHRRAGHHLAPRPLSTAATSSRSSALASRCWRWARTKPR